MPLTDACRFILCALPFVLEAASIRGMVVEHHTGKALARALVAIQPVTGTSGVAQSLRTNNYGAFQFNSLGPGAYIVKASRRGFVPTEHGQKRWNSAGVPVVLAPDASPVITIRMPRYGVITGTVVDENDVGLSEHDVIAYRATTPPRIIARGTSDERGTYRIFGLEPGDYVVRTAGKRDEAISYAPTFSKETLRLEEARPLQVYLDEETKSVDVRPLPGRLFTLSGDTEPSNAGPVTVVLASDLGRLRTQGPGYRFDSLAPGQYELYAEIPENSKTGSRIQAAYLYLNINSEPKPPVMTLQPVRETRFEIASGPVASDSNPTEIIVRRKDFAGVEEPRVIRLNGDRALLPPGRWEVMLVPPPGYYVSGFLGPSRGSPNKIRPDGWNEILLSSGTYATVRFTLSTGSGAIHGSVKSAGEMVVGAPVYLEAYDRSTRQRIGELRPARTDTRGAYRFDGLAPGAYRVLATFEYNDPEPTVMTTAPTVDVDPGAAVKLDLDLYIIP